MSKKVRFRFNTSVQLKRTHKQMLGNFEVTNISSNNTKLDGTHMFFSVKDKAEETRVKDHFDKIGIKLTQV